MLQTRVAPRRCSLEVSSPPPSQVPQGRSRAPDSRPCPLVGVHLQPLIALAAPLMWPEPSGIFNWKLISSSLNRRPRQRRATTHPHSQPPLPTWEETQREPSCTALKWGSSKYYIEGTYIDFLKVVNLVKISSCLLSSTSRCNFVKRKLLSKQAATCPEPGVPGRARRSDPPATQPRNRPRWALPGMGQKRV